jgi:hypothetical protein
VIVIDFQSRLPTAPFPLQQRQVVFVGGGNSYIVTCSAKTDTFARYTEVFDAVLASFKVPAPRGGQGFDWNRVLLYGIIGGVVGGLVGLFKKLAGRKKPT